MSENFQSLKGFNIRVYGIYIHNDKLLTLKEKYGKWEMIKLPGGGLELGEGVIDCLKRECKEELNIDIVVRNVFYVQENYVSSIVNDNRQILVLYYFIDIINYEQIRIQDTHIEYIVWTDLNEDNPLTLPVDKIMYEKLKGYLKDKNK